MQLPTPTRRSGSGPPAFGPLGSVSKMAGPRLLPVDKTLKYKPNSGGVLMSCPSTNGVTPSSSTLKSIVMGATAHACEQANSNPSTANPRCFCIFASLSLNWIIQTEPASQVSRLSDSGSFRRFDHEPSTHPRRDSTQTRLDVVRAFSRYSSFLSFPKPFSRLPEAQWLPRVQLDGRNGALLFPFMQPFELAAQPNLLPSRLSGSIIHPAIPIVRTNRADQS